MAEDSSEQDSNEELIAGLEEGDLKPNVYEGGFKTWECALDLGRLVASEDLMGFFETDDDLERHVIEVCDVVSCSGLVVLYADWVDLVGRRNCHSVSCVVCAVTSEE